LTLFAILSGIIVGLGFGYALQRGRFCSNTGFRDILLIQDSTLFRAWALAVVVQLVGVTTLSSLGFLPVTVPPFWWAANIIGGVAFGIGMVLAGGCSSGTCYRVGEGLAGSLLALIAFGMGIIIMSRGVLAPLQDALQGQVIGEGLTLHSLLGINPWLIVVPVAALSFLWFWRSGRSGYHSGGWEWQTAGVALGVVGIAAWLASAANGRYYGLSMTGPLRSWFEALFDGALNLDWGSMLIVGLMVGAFISSRVNQEWRWRVPKGERLLQSGFGGLLMGFGAQLAGGCTIGHSLTGLSVMSVGSLVTTISILLGAWGTAYWLFVRPAQQSERSTTMSPAGD
jgi:uncharacterized membrane protein YedE/YeeE